MFTVSIRVIAFMNSPEIVVYLYWISLLVLVIVAVDFIVSVFTSIAVEVSNIVFVLTSIEIICEISLLASDFAEAPAAFTFIDEFDSIAKTRDGASNARFDDPIVNQFLGCMSDLEKSKAPAFIVAATNAIESIDKAMFRRFDDVIEYRMPDAQQRLLLLREYLYTAKNLDFSQAEPLFMGMSHAEIKMVCSDIFKESLLNDLPIDMEMVKMIVDKRNQLCREIG